MTKYSLDKLKSICENSSYENSDELEAIQDVINAYNLDSIKAVLNHFNCWIDFCCAGDPKYQQDNINYFNKLMEIYEEWTKEA